jgi:hypothetical protein
MTNKAYSYIRFTSALQAKGKSYERQLENSKKYCEEQGLDLVIGHVRKSVCEPGEGINN